MIHFFLILTVCRKFVQYFLMALIGCMREDILDTRTCGHRILRAPSFLSSQAGITATASDSVPGGVWAILGVWASLGAKPILSPGRGDGGLSSHTAICCPKRRFSELFDFSIPHRFSCERLFPVPLGGGGCCPTPGSCPIGPLIDRNSHPRRCEGAIRPKCSRDSFEGGGLLLCHVPREPRIISFLTAVVFGCA